MYLYTQTHRDSDGSPARHLSLSHRICQAECWHLLLESYPEKHAFPGNLCTNECKPGVHMIPYVPPETILSADGSLAHYRGKHAKQSADHLIPLSMHSRCASTNLGKRMQARNAHDSIHGCGLLFVHPQVCLLATGTTCVF